MSGREELIEAANISLRPPDRLNYASEEELVVQDQGKIITAVYADDSTEILERMHIATFVDDDLWKTPRSESAPSLGSW